MLAAERQRRNQRQMERRAKPARRSSRFMYPKTAARRLHQSRCDPKNQNPQNGHLMARFDWGFGAICFGASPVAAVFGSAPGNATSPKHRIHSNPAPPAAPSKQDISTLLGIGHFYFALTPFQWYVPAAPLQASDGPAPDSAPVTPRWLAVSCRPVHPVPSRRPNRGRPCTTLSAFRRCRCSRW